MDVNCVPSSRPTRSSDSEADWCFFGRLARGRERLTSTRNRRALRQPRYAEDVVPEWMVVRRREVDDRILIRGQRPADLLVELLLRLRPVVIRDEQKPTLEKIFAEPLHLGISEQSGARIFH